MKKDQFYYQDPELKEIEKALKIRNARINRYLDSLKNKITKWKKVEEV